MKLDQVTALDWDKNDGLLPAIVQDARSGQVLMLAYMNREALRITLAEKRATFFSRSRNKLWTKGESSGHWLHVVDVETDCDRDTLLVLANPEGPTCHTGTRSCFGDELETDAAGLSFLMRLESVIAQRISDRPEGSYTARLWSEGPTRIAQKVGEEGVEVALAAVTQDDERLVGESADLLYHLALLLKNRNLSLTTVVRELEQQTQAVGQRHLQEIQLQAWARPARFHQLPRSRQRDVRIAHICAAEADVGRHRIRERDVLERAVRREHRDAAVEQRRRTHVAACFHGEAVEPLVAGQRADDAVAASER